jgi:arginase family enzyme
LYTAYNFELGVDLRESLKMCDVGDISCPANITKSHDQITKGVAHILSQGAGRAAEIRLRFNVLRAELGWDTSGAGDPLPQAAQCLFA